LNLGVSMTYPLGRALPARRSATAAPGCRFTALRRALGAGALAALLILLPFCVASGQTTAARKATAQSGNKKSPFPRIEQLIRQGLLDQAKTEIQEQIARQPKSVEAYNLLGIICVEQKDFPCAQDAFQHALQLRPGSAPARNDLGNVYVAEGKADLAAKEFRIILRSDPANRDANYNLGLLLLSRNQSSQALLHLERVHPANMATRLNLIRAYLQAGKTAEGLGEANRLSNENKGDVQLHFTLGAVLVSAKQFHRAQLELEQANALEPENAEILYELGDAYLNGGDAGKADAAASRALKLKPDSPEILYLLAQVYQQEKRTIDALDVLVRAHKLAPENVDVIFLLARVSMTQNYFEDAIPLLESGIQLASKRPDLRAALGESYFMAGKAEKAIEVFQTLVELDPAARSYAFLGLAYRHLGRFEEATKYFQAGLKQDPHNVSCLFNLGYIEEHQGHPARAEVLFQQVLRLDPDLPEALLETANLRMESKKYEQAAALLRKYVKVSREPSTGYYKLAMVERSLHQMEAALRDLNVFQTLSKNTPAGPYPFQNLFEYVDNRSSLAPRAQAEMDLAQLADEIHKHPDQPENLYLLAEAHLKLGNVEQARSAVAQLDQLSVRDYRTQTGVGVLFARYHLYDDAIQHFQAALRANPESDDVKFDLADACFRKRAYRQALEAAQQVSPEGQHDTAYLALLGDIYAHLGDERASAIFQDAIARNPDNDQYYLSLAMTQLRSGKVDAAAETLQKGVARNPASGKILWGLGLVAVLQGKTPEAAEDLQRAVDLLPEWPGGYSTLGVFYYQTGEIDRAREMLNRFKGSNVAGGFDVSRIEQALSLAPASESSLDKPMPMAARQQFLQFALSIADRTL
jgi:tetratricopeptide (TPR) repeat protein